MNATVAIARREIADKKFVLATALAIAVLPFLLPLLPGSHASPTEVILVSAGIFATGFTAGLAAILGASFIGRDVSEGRMSFFFARPVSSLAIYFGKLSAALFLMVAGFTIIAAPAMLVEREAWGQVWTEKATPVLIFILSYSLGLFVLAHVVSTWVRSRSSLVALDLVLAVLSGTAVWYVVRPLVAASATLDVTRLAIGLGIAFVVAILGAGAWQVAHGRIDRKRNHFELSKVLWPALAVIIAIAAGIVLWITGGAPTELNKFQAIGAPGGQHAILVGDMNHRGDYVAGFVVDTETGKYDRIGAGWRWNAAYTLDGSKLVLGREGSKAGNYDVTVRDLKTGTETDTGLTTRATDSIVPNDDATKIAAVNRNGGVAVYDVPAKRSLASVKFPDDSWLESAFFSGPRTLRVYRVVKTNNANVGPRTLTIHEIDLVNRTHVQTGSITLNAKYLYAVVSEVGTRMRLRANDPESIVVADARTGAVINTIATNRGPVIGTAAFLRDGGIAVGDARPDGGVLRVFDAAGNERGSYPLGASERIWPVREIVPGKILAGRRMDGSDWYGAIVDLATGKVTQAQAGRPLLAGEFDGTADPRTRPAGPSLLLFHDKTLVRWNVLTNEKKTLIGS